MSTKTQDNDTQASHPGGLRVSQAKLRALHPELDSGVAWLRFITKVPIYSKRSFWRARIPEHLLYGDSRAAVVVSTEPLLVAAYTDELDCIALLKFPDSFVSEYDLGVGSRLLTVNTYFYPDEPHADDLEIGPNAYGRYVNFSPFIADFLTDDVETVEQRKAEISEYEWRKTAELGNRYLDDRIAPPRDGRPLLSCLPIERSAGHFSVRKILDYLFGLMIFVIGTTWGVRTIAVDARAGWGAIIIFGALSLVMIVQIVKLCGADEQQPRVDAKPNQRLRRALVWTATAIISVVLGLSENFMSHWLNNSVVALWFAAFLTNLAFYPLRGEQKR